MKRRTLTDKDVELMKTSTPPLSEGSPRLFRSLRDKGIIMSFTQNIVLALFDGYQNANGDSLIFLYRAPGF